MQYGPPAVGRALSRDDLTRRTRPTHLRLPPSYTPVPLPQAEMCGYLVPQPADLLSAFADWTNTHYGTGFGSSCYYSTECLRNPAYASQWPNQVRVRRGLPS